MTIASSSGLNDKDIEKMVADAEQYAESDKARKNLIEEANKADSVCSDTEKGMYSDYIISYIISDIFLHSHERIQRSVRRL